MDVVLTPGQVAKAIGKTEAEVSEMLERVKNCQLVTLVVDGKLFIAIPSSDSPAVKDADKLYTQFIRDRGRALNEGAR